MNAAVCHGAAPTQSNREASPANARGVQIMSKDRNALPRMPPPNDSRGQFTELQKVRVGTIKIQ